MEKLQQSTLTFLVKKNQGKVSEVCLAMKKRGFGLGRYNGAGGKLMPGEGMEEAACREVEEEVGVKVIDLQKAGEITFIYTHDSKHDQLVGVFISDNWQGDLSESEEMKPEWFHVDGVPYKNMWPDDMLWLPHVLAGKYVKAKFVFDQNYTITDQEIEII